MRNNLEKLMIEMLIIVSLVAVFGFWGLNEWKKRYPITGTLDEIHMSKQVKIYQGKWHNSYLEVGIDTITSEPVFKESVDSIKAKIGTMYGTDTPMEVIK